MNIAFDPESGMAQSFSFYWWYFRRRLPVGRS